MNMNLKLRELLEQDSRSNVEVARRLGMSTGQALYSRLRPDSTPKVDFVAALLAELGYTLAVVPSGAKLPRGSFAVEPDFEYESMPARAVRGKGGAR